MRDKRQVANVRPLTACVAISAPGGCLRGEDGPSYTWERGRIAFTLALFFYITFRRADVRMQTILPAQVFHGAPGGRALPGTEASAIQQTRIEPIVDRLADLDFFEIGMLGI